MWLSLHCLHGLFEANSNIGIWRCLGVEGVRMVFVKFEVLIYVLEKKGAL